MAYIRGYRPPVASSSSGKWERGLIVGAIILVLLGAGGFIYDRLQRTVDQPVSSGTYTEGILADSPTKTDRIISRLTNIGLTYRDKDNSIKPALAESWEVSPDNKVYTFKIRDAYSADGLLSIIQGAKTDWTGITMAVVEGNKLQFTLAEPLGLFLGTTTNPLFPYGPFEIVKRDKKEVLLKANETFALGKPYLQKIVLKPYETKDELTKAADNGEIQGSADLAESPGKRFTEYTSDLPRYYVLVFNTTRPTLKKMDERLRITQEKDGNPVTYTLVSSQSGVGSELADSLVKKLQPHGITLTSQKKTSVLLQKDELLKREFDLLIYGINYGVDRDYYPLWHSSQAASGLNISGIKDKELDALLETARKEVDPQKRQTLNESIEKMLQDKGLQQTLTQEKATFWVDTSIKGVQYGMMDESTDRFNLAWKWYIKSKKVKPTE